MIAGERGAFFRSRDGGQTWERKRLPYEGSMFGILAWDAGHLLAFGLRGNLFRSGDAGVTREPRRVQFAVVDDVADDRREQASNRL